MSADAGRLSIDINQTVGTINGKVVSMTYATKPQILRLRGYRVQFDTAPNALAAGVLYLDITNTNNESIFSYNHLIDNNPSVLLFSLPLDNAVVTNKDSLNKPLYMSRKGDSTLKVSAYTIDTAGVVSLCPNLLRLYLDFETENGSLII